jgi:hypothetical protein
MASTRRPKAPLVLGDEERLTLERLATRRNSAQAIALRARIVVACPSGKTNRQVAGELKVAESTVGKWRSRFVARRLDGRHDEDRPGASPHDHRGEGGDDTIQMEMRFGRTGDLVRFGTRC